MVTMVGLVPGDMISRLLSCVSWLIRVMLSMAFVLTCVRLW